MNSAITLEALQVLNAIDQRGSYAAAAEELNKVPSALSYIVQKLEQQLGVTIYQKQGRRAVLTPAGKYLLQEGRTLLEAAAQLSERTRTIAHGWEPKIRIAIDSMFNTETTFRTIATFLQDHPDMEVDIREEVMSGGWEALIEDQVDLLLGAAGPVPQQQGIRAVSVARLDRIFAVSPEHPLANCPQPISHERLARERTVIVHDSARSAIPWSKGIIVDNRHFYVPTVDCKIRAQLAGIGCGYLPRQRVQQDLQAGRLVALEIEDPPFSEETEMYLAWKIANRGKGLMALKETFLKSPEKLSC